MSAEVVLFRLQAAQQLLAEHHGQPSHAQVSRAQCEIVLHLFGLPAIEHCRPRQHRRSCGPLCLGSPGGEGFDHGSPQQSGSSFISEQSDAGLQALEQLFHRRSVVHTLGPRYMQHGEVDSRLRAGAQLGFAQSVGAHICMPVLFAAHMLRGEKPRLGHLQLRTSKNSSSM